MSADPAAICGGNKFALDASRVGCGAPIVSCAEVFRCVDCSIPFHVECCIRHFGVTPDRTTCLRKQLSENDGSVQLLNTQLYIAMTENEKLRKEVEELKRHTDITLVLPHLRGIAAWLETQKAK